MNIAEKVKFLINYKKNLETTAKLVEKFKKQGDLTRSIDKTIGYLEKEKIKIKYRVK